MNGRPTKRERILLSVLLFAATGFAQEQPIAFTHVTVIDATGRPALPDRTVTIRGGRIQSIAGANVARPKDARVIDAAGKFMIPGLWDMHIHFRGGSELIPDNEAWLSVFLANGVTGVREMGGDIADTVFGWRKQIAEGTRLGPRIFTSGPKLDSPKPIWPGSIPVTDPESARAAVVKLKSMGADFVKLYSIDFPLPVFTALMDEAKKQRLHVGGHMPFTTLTAREAIDNGARFIEHAQYYILSGCSPQEKQINDEFVARGKTGRPMGYPELAFRYAQTFNSKLAEELIARLVRRGVWVTPTLAVGRQRETAGSDDHERDSQRAYVFPGMWKSWDLKTGRRQPYTELEVKQLGFVKEKTSALVKLMQERKVGLLAGSDSGASNNFTFPGWTLHRELALLVESGLTPMEALQTATRNPARFLGELSSSGTIEKNKVANVVLLNANPLEDIRNTQKIDSVVLKGRLLTRADLDKLLADVAGAAKRSN